jgi:hypothetical protein
MIMDGLHPNDREKLQHLGQMLVDCSRPGVQRETWFLTIRWRVGELMLCTRPDCSTEGAEEVAQRLLAVADHRLGSEAMMDAACVEILAHGLSWNWESPE